MADVVRTLDECILCHSAIKDELHYGETKTLDKHRVHYFCLFFSSGLEQNGDDHEGILGFLPDDVYREVARGNKEYCIYCKKKGATVRCSYASCRKTFHYSCGMKNGTLHQFFGIYRSFCHIHRLKQKVAASYLKSKVPCSVCLIDMVGQVTKDSLWAPCCKNGWFHRICIEKLALNTGYFFKCPLCNNVQKFVKMMQKFGIYVPSRDASWELEENAYQELLLTYSHCDAVVCRCPNGRDYVGNQIGKRYWQLLVCVTCGSQGCHRKCANKSSLRWECPDCKEITYRVKYNKSKKKRKYVRRNIGETNHIESNNSSDRMLEDIPNNTVNQVLKEVKNDAIEIKDDSNILSKETIQASHSPTGQILQDVRKKACNNKLSLAISTKTITVKDFIESKSLPSEHYLIDFPEKECNYDFFDMLNFYEKEVKSIPKQSEVNLHWPSTSECTTTKTESVSNKKVSKNSESPLVIKENDSKTKAVNELVEIIDLIDNDQCITDGCDDDVVEMIDITDEMHEVINIEEDLIELD